MTERTKTPGEALRSLRELSGLTLKQVAYGADTSIAYLSKVERNVHYPTQEYVAKVAGFIATSMLEQGSK